jgi:hypothetical protein
MHKWISPCRLDSYVDITLRVDVGGFFDFFFDILKRLSFTLTDLASLNK